MKLIALACLLVAISPSPIAHKFEDGFVERTMAIVLRGRTAQVEYRVGLNDTTIRQILEKWDTLPADSTNKDISPPTKDPNQVQDASVKPSFPVESEKKLDPVVRSAPPDATEQNGSSSPEQPPDKKTESNDPPASNSAQDSNATDHVIDAVLFEKFEQAAPKAIANGLNIRCNGKPVAVTALAAGPSPRHPFTIVVTFEFQLPKSESSELSIVDANFAKQTGAVRYALKATGNAALIQSNVAPILVRAERIELSDATNRERKRQTTISARVAVLPSSK